MSSKSSSGLSKTGISGVLIIIVVGVLFFANILTGTQKPPCATCVPHPTITAQVPLATPKPLHTSTPKATATVTATATFVPPVPTAPPVVTVVATIPAPAPTAQVTAPRPVGTKGAK